MERRGEEGQGDEFLSVEETGCRAEEFSGVTGQSDRVPATILLLEAKESDPIDILPLSNQFRVAAWSWILDESEAIIPSFSGQRSSVVYNRRRGVIEDQQLFRCRNRRNPIPSTIFHCLVNSEWRLGLDLGRIRQSPFPSFNGQRRSSNQPTHLTFRRHLYLRERWSPAVSALGLAIQFGTDAGEETTSKGSIALDSPFGLQVDLRVFA